MKCNYNEILVHLIYLYLLLILILPSLNQRKSVGLLLDVRFLFSEAGIKRTPVWEWFILVDVDRASVLVLPWRLHWEFITSFSIMISGGACFISHTPQKHSAGRSRTASRGRRVVHTENTHISSTCCMHCRRTVSKDNLTKHTETHEKQSTHTLDFVLKAISRRYKTAVKMSQMSFTCFDNSQSAFIC